MYLAINETVDLTLIVKPYKDPRGGHLNFVKVHVISDFDEHQASVTGTSSKHFEHLISEDEVVCGKTVEDAVNELLDYLGLEHYEG